MPLKSLFSGFRLSRKAEIAASPADAQLEPWEFPQFFPQLWKTLGRDQIGPTFQRQRACEKTATLTQHATRCHTLETVDFWHVFVACRGRATRPGR
jgi:hypothetical protein